MQVRTDVEDSEQNEARSSSLLRPAAEPEHSTGAAEEVCTSPESVVEPSRWSGKSRQVDSGSPRAELEAHEQMHQEIGEALEREERKLNERRKRVGGGTKLKRLIQDTLELNALKQFNNLQVEYHRKKARNPNLKLHPYHEASTAIARRMGKSDYYARKLRERLSYLYRVGELQVSKQGKGATHRSLLSEPQIVAGVQAWVKGAIPVDKGGYTGRVQYLR